MTTIADVMIEVVRIGGLNWRKYMNGNCYNFYLELKKKFPESEAYYNDDHVITKIGDSYYDASGRVEKENHLNVDRYYSHKYLKKAFNINE